MKWNDFFSLSLDEIKVKLEEDYSLSNEEIDFLIQIKDENKRDERLAKVENILKEEWNLEDEIIASYLMVYALNSKLEEKGSQKNIKNINILTSLAIFQILSAKLIKNNHLLTLSSSVVILGTGNIAYKMMKKEKIDEDLVLQKVKKKVQ